jgi:hypothetical protein
VANAFYVKGAERILAAALLASAPVAGTLKVVLVKNTYPQNLSTDEFYSTISAYVVGSPQPLASPVVAGGKLDASDDVFAAIASGNTLEAVVIYMDTGNPATSWLIAYIDTLTGFPLVTNGGDVNVQWDNGTYKIASLV